MQHFSTVSSLPSAGYLQGSTNLAGAGIVYGSGGTFAGASFNLKGHTGTPRSGTLSAPTGPSDVAAQITTASGGDFSASTVVIGSSVFLLITDGVTGDASSLEATSGTLLSLVGLTAGQSSTGSSNAPPFPSAIVAGTNADPFNTATLQLMQKPIAEALGNLRNTSLRASVANTLTEDLTLAGDAKIVYGSREVIRVINPVGQSEDGTFWTMDSSSAWKNRSGGLGKTLTLEIPLPHNCVLKEINISYKGNNIHTDLPDVMPSAQLFYRRFGDVDALASSEAFDESANVSDFQAIHSIDIVLADDGLTIDRTQYGYYVRVIAESGANAQVGAEVTAIRLRYDVTEQDPG